MTFDRSALKEAKRIVVKVGTSTITYANGKRNFEQIDRLARELADLQNQGKEMILVTSGAVAVGVDRLGLSEKPKTIPGKQAAAAVGQGILMHTYEKLFAEYGQIVAQVLLTKTESLDRHRYTNSRNTFMELLKNRVIPIVNENDVVALDELKIGDNDNMSALVAGIVDADLVVILSDVDGLYTANPQTHPGTNMVLDVVLVGVLRWGVEGAAVATFLSQIVGGLLPVFYFLDRNNTSRLHLSRTKFHGRVLRNACINGSSELMTNLSMSLVNILYNYQLLRFAGEDGVAAYGVIMYAAFLFVAVFVG